MLRELLHVMVEKCFPYENGPKPSGLWAEIVRLNDEIVRLNGIIFDIRDQSPLRSLARKVRDLSLAWLTPTGSRTKPWEA
jgi:hypothetical protein